MRPENLKYAPSHEWVRLDGGIAVVGITDHAQEALGDITFVELPKVGKPVKKGAACGVIESVKAASDLYSPVSGEIAEINPALEKTPELVNQEPFGKGWIFKVKNVDAAELGGLLDAAGYEASLGAE